MGAGARLPVGCVDVCSRRSEGHLNVLQWAREHNCPCGEHICDYAAEGGHLQMLQWGRGRTAVRAPTLKYCSDVPP